jgi:hypothetical protein
MVIYLWFSQMAMQSHGQTEHGQAEYNQLVQIFAA